MKTINSFRSKLLALTFTLMASVSSFAYDFTFGNDFHIDGFAYKIISRTNPCSVALIEVADCEKHVAIPESVTYNDSTFIVTTLGMGNIVFSGTARNTMESIYIPKTIMIVNYCALGYCPNLKSIVVDEENKYLDSRNNCNAIISSNDTYRPANQLVVGCKTTVIPNSVSEIGNYAFVRCKTLENITIPEGVTRICDGAFYECTSLSSIKLPESITQLPQQWIFSGCTSLKEVFFFAKTPPYIAYGMFIGITPTIYVPKESLDAYKKALYWQNFDIQAIPYKSQWCDTWNMLVRTSTIYPPSSTPYRYKLAKDTVIGEHTYTAVVQKAINDALDAPWYVAAVRFTDDRKVYVYYDNAEYLLYDFNVQEGDELEVFAGINNYTSEIKTYKCTVTGVEQYACVGCPAAITLEVHNHPDDFREFYRETQWIEGVGDINGFLNGINHYVEMDGGGSEYLLCAYKGDELKYTGDLYEEYGCGDDAEQSPEDLFPTLWGLQRTEVEFHTDGASAPSLVSFNEYTPTLVNGKLYLYDGRNYLREENNQVLLYAPDVEIYEDVVLYDWALEVGDTLPYHNKSVYRESDYIVTDVSTITLLDGKKYKKWTLACGYEYIESIGAINGHGYGLFLCLPHYSLLGTYIDTRLVCASRNGQLLYQMDEAEMERLGTECLCDYDRGPLKDNAKNGKIGGRPTPTQWNMLEVETKEMDGTPTILRAETFSYTLENDSIIANNKTFYQLARQSTKDTAITKSFVGALHFGEDEDNRVYFLRDGVEYVLYDFTAEPGDTIEIFAGINNYPQETTYTHVVTGKDTLENGACRMMLEVVFPEEIGSDLEQQHLQKVWLAGLGSIDGIVHNAATRATKARSSETQTSVMLCAWRDDDCLYTTDHPDYDSYGCVYNLPTSIKNIETPGGKCQKLIRDGHLYIIHNGTVYNVIGLEVK